MSFETCRKCNEEVDLEADDYVKRFFSNVPAWYHLKCYEKNDVDAS